VKPILFRAGARYHLHHPLQLALALLGVTLGVAVVTAVDLATDSARRAFTVSTEAVSGRATHEVTGGPAGLADSLYVLVRGRTAGSAAPVMDRHVRLPDAGGRMLRLLGVDPFAEAPFRPWAAPAGGAASIGTLLTRRSILLPATTAAELGLDTGDDVTVTFGARRSTVIVAGVIETADATARRALADVAIADIATVQEVTGASGVLDRIELRLDGDDDVAAITAALPPGVRMLDAGVRAGATLRMTRAFETNLTALALVALVFGMFLIYNSVTFSLVQRRPLIALLRAQGVTATEVFRLVMAEAAIIGVVATTFGLAAGALLGSGLVGLVARTINDLYFTVAVTDITLTLPTVLKARRSASVRRWRRHSRRHGKRWPRRRA
jgi:putative ABC transport system permease protein